MGRVLSGSGEELVSQARVVVMVRSQGRQHPPVDPREQYDKRRHRVYLS